MRALGVLALLAGCYSIDPAEGLPCTEDHRCPGDLKCEPDTNTCVSELPPSLGVASIAAGARHSCGVDLGGHIYCWGANDQGQLGTGDTSDHALPTLVETPEPVNTVRAGQNATCALTTMGELYCWGSQAQLGGTSGANAPRKIDVQPLWRSVSVGDDGFCAVADDRSTWCSTDGGLAMVADSSYNADSVVYSRGRQCILDTSNHLFCWGADDRYQVGILPPAPDNYDWSTPQAIMPEATFTSIAAGPIHTCAVDVAGDLWCWGSCENYETGVAPGGVPYCLPERVKGGPYLRVAAAGSTTCAVTDEQTVKCFGMNEYGQLGTATINPWSEPVDVELPTGITFYNLTVGDTHACATPGDASAAYCWGNNSHGQLGTGDTSLAVTPAAVPGGPWLEVSAGLASTCALDANHALWCWGHNAGGQLGVGTTTHELAPRQVGSDSSWEQVSAGSSHTCARTSGGELYCWGANGRGQLGLASSFDFQTEPAKVAGSGWTDVAAGTMITCGLSDTVYCWGDDESSPSTPPGTTAGPYHDLTAHGGWATVPDGPLAIANDTLYEVSPWDVKDQSPFPGTLSVTPLHITRGFDHDCALATDNKVYCWGFNDFGQTGHSSGDPAVEERNLTWSAVDAGTWSTCGITFDGKLYCWGIDLTLGSSTTELANEQPTPVDASSTYKRVSVGDHHACAIRDDGTLVCWGVNSDGEVGGGPTGYFHPVHVRSPAP